MNARTPTPESACVTVETVLQSFLDGDAIDLVAKTTDHCGSCPDCRANVRAAVELRRALLLSSSPMIPAGMTDRIVAAVLAEPVSPNRRVRLQRAGIWVAVAASLVLAVGFLTVRFWPTPERPQPEVAFVPAVEPLALRDRVADAGNAMLSFTRRTADEAVEPTRNLILNGFDPMALDLVGRFPKTIDPAAQSLQQVRQGTASGLEPMANSARRAFSMFLDLPPVDPDRKPDF